MENIHPPWKIPVPCDPGEEGGYQGRLGDSGDIVRLESPAVSSPEDVESSVVVLADEVVYEIADPWPIPTDSVTNSLVRQDILGWGNLPNSWKTASASPGESDLARPSPGDANLDDQFDQADIVAVRQAATYRTGEPASWSDGDWNFDGVFDQLDMVAALQIGNYLQGPYASLAKSARDAEVDAVFDEEGLQRLIWLI